MSRRRRQRRWPGQSCFEIPTLGPNRSREAECGKIPRAPGIRRDHRGLSCDRAWVQRYADLGRCFSTNGRRRRRSRQAANSEPDKVHRIPSGQVTPGDMRCFADPDHSLRSAACFHSLALNGILENGSFLGRAAFTEGVPGLASPVAGTLADLSSVIRTARLAGQCCFRLQNWPGVVWRLRKNGDRLRVFQFSQPNIATCTPASFFSTTFLGLPTGRGSEAAAASAPVPQRTPSNQGAAPGRRPGTSACIVQSNFWCSQAVFFSPPQVSSHRLSCSTE